MDGSVIREFLVALGFKVDAQSFKKFQVGLKSATEAAKTLGEEVAAMGAAVTAAAIKVSASFEDLYYASQRIGASVSGIRNASFAVSQLGGSAANAKQSLENIAERLWTNPGYAPFLSGMGVQLQMVNGQAKLTDQSMDQLRASFLRMPQWAAWQRAQMLGIDQRTFQALISPDYEKEEGRRKAIAASFGLNEQQAAESSHKFMQDLRDLLMVMTLAMDRLVVIIQPIFDVVVKGLMAVNDATHGWSSSLLVLAGSAAAVLKALSLVRGLGGVLKGVALGGAGAGEAVAGGAEAAGAMAAAGPPGWILLAIAAFAALVVAVGAWLMTSRKARADFSEGWRRAIEPLKPALDSLSEAFGEVSAAFAPLWTAMKPFLDATVKALNAFRDALASAFGDAMIATVKAGVAALVAGMQGVASVARLVAAVMRGDWAGAAAVATKMGAGQDTAPGAASAGGGGGGAASAPQPSPAAAAVHQAASAVVQGAQGVAQGLSSEVPNDYWGKLAKIESGGAKDPVHAKAPTSSASGLYQFVKKSWLKEGGEWGTDKKQPFGGLNISAEEQVARIKSFTAENIASLKAAHIPINEETVYAAHFLGAPTAIRILRADTNARADLIAGPKATKANWRVLYGKTVGQFDEWLNRQMGDAPLVGGHSGIPSSNTVNVHQNTNITVHGVSDASGTAKSVSQAQQRVNGIMLRHLQSNLG